MYCVKVKVTISAIAVLAMTGCATTKQDVSIELEKPAGLTRALDEIKTPVASEQSSGYDAFELVGIADDAYEREDWAQAEKYYRRLINQVPQDAYGYFRLGNVLMQYAKVDNAINAYNQALKREPTHVRALKNRSLAYLLNAELNLESTVKSLQSLNDSSSQSYMVALANLQRLNAMPLTESVSPVQGLYRDNSNSEVQFSEE